MENQTHIKAIFAIAHSLSMTVICEGVENKEQEAFLIHHHYCEVAQGHLYSKALEDPQLSDWIKQNKPS